MIAIRRGSQWGGGFYGLSAKSLALLRPSVNFYQLRLTKKFDRQRQYRGTQRGYSSKPLNKALLSVF